VHRIILHKNAARFYNNADAALKSRISKAFDIIAKDPRYHKHIKKLKGDLRNMYRSRLGNMRIIYEIEDEIMVVRIKAIETRGSAY
jgi:mRNA interferase RelE/StbE